MGRTPFFTDQLVFAVEGGALGVFVKFVFAVIEKLQGIAGQPRPFIAGAEGDVVLVFPRIGRLVEGFDDAAAVALVLLEGETLGEAVGHDGRGDLR